MYRRETHSRSGVMKNAAAACTKTGILLKKAGGAGAADGAGVAFWLFNYSLIVSPVAVWGLTLGRF